MPLPAIQELQTAFEEEFVRNNISIIFLTRSFQSTQQLGTFLVLFSPVLTIEMQWTGQTKYSIQLIYDNYLSAIYFWFFDVYLKRMTV